MQTLAEFIGNEPTRQIGAGAGRERNDHFHRPGRIVLRRGGVRPQPEKNR